MRRIYFTNKAFVFCQTPPEGECCSINVSPDEVFEPAKLLQKVENNKTLYIISSDPDRNFELFCSQFKIVDAAGGVVENESGEVLMIFRRRWWDLPKGHVENGESNEQAAIREVCEETGLQNVKIIEPICTTQHFYNTYGEWEIKKIWWYLMKTEGVPKITPQTEEGISRVEWLRGDKLWSAVAMSYSTIKDVFNEFLTIKNK